jgi:hypothetical protein|tara:strand:- start:223 stop:687 length:465 start_codon:yes stop_codon:yes gene_type:complete
MPALLTSLPTARAAVVSVAVPKRVASRVAVRVHASAAKQEAQSVHLGRRNAALGLGAALVSVFVGADKANAVECNLVTPCMPGTEAGAPPRYQMPGPAYSPAEAAEERFRIKIQAERAVEKAAYETQYNREKAASEAAAGNAPAEAAVQEPAVP